MYLAGTAYHQGYLAGLGINTTLMPLNVNDTYVQAFFGTISVLTAAIAFFNSHAGGSIGLLIAFVVFLTLIFHRKEVAPVQADSQIGARLIDTSGAPIDTSSERSVHLRKKPLSDVLDSFFVVGASTYFLALAIFGFLLCSFFVVTPYFYAGKAEAKKDLAAKFSDQSKVALVTRERGLQLFSLVECGQDFCVAYSVSSGVVSIPKSAVTWVASAKVSQ
jgi:hypothetical protein